MYLAPLARSTALVPRRNVYIFTFKVLMVLYRWIRINHTFFRS